jgi:hypothetical protein
MFRASICPLSTVLARYNAAGGLVGCTASVFLGYLAGSSYTALEKTPAAEPSRRSAGNKRTFSPHGQGSTLLPRRSVFR